MENIKSSKNLKEAQKRAANALADELSGLPVEEAEQRIENLIRKENPNLVPSSSEIT